MKMERGGNACLFVRCAVRRTRHALRPHAAARALQRRRVHVMAHADQGAGSDVPEKDLRLPHGGAGDGGAMEDRGGAVDAAARARCVPGPSESPVRAEGGDGSA